MFRSRLTKAVLLLVIVSLVVPIAGCTKEKAEAVKNAAEQFRLESKAALAQISNLAKQDVALPAMTNEEEVKRLAAAATTVATPADLASFVDSKTDVKRRFDAMTAAVDQDLRDMEEVYDLFASMYRSLPKGHFFAKGAVKQSKVYAIKLTMKMVQ